MNYLYAWRGLLSPQEAFLVFKRGVCCLSSVLIEEKQKEKCDVRPNHLQMNDG